MNARVDAFAGFKDAPVFEPKLKSQKPPAQEAIDRIAEENNFPSRAARKKPSTPKRQPRVYRTGRNRHFSLKVTNEALERFYKAADDRGVTLGRLLELALDALEREGVSGQEPRSLG